MNKVEVRLKNEIAQGYEVVFPNANLVFVLAKKGYVMCGYLDIRTANKLGDVAAIVRGVKTVEDLLQAKIQEVSEAAQSLGISAGMTGKEALNKMGGGECMNRKELFDLFKTAIEKEQSAQKFYEGLIAVAPDPAMKKILAEFLNQERYHEEKLEEMYAELKNRGNNNSE